MQTELEDLCFLLWFFPNDCHAFSGGTVTDKARAGAKGQIFPTPVTHLIQRQVYFQQVKRNKGCTSMTLQKIVFSGFLSGTLIIWYLSCALNQQSQERQH